MADSELSRSDRGLAVLSALLVPVALAVSARTVLEGDAGLAQVAGPVAAFAAGMVAGWLAISRGAIACAAVAFVVTVATFVLVDALAVAQFATNRLAAVAVASGVMSTAFGCVAARLGELMPPGNRG